MKLGKLPPALLERLLSRITPDPRVLVGPRLGEDAAVIEMGDRLLVAKTDPITFATEHIGWYAVQVNANDVAVMGAIPRWFLATMLLPEGCVPEDVEGMFDQVQSACQSLGVSLVGGHTEVTQGLERPILVGCMLGEIEGREVITSSGAQEGDDLFLTKGVAIEGTAILALEYGDLLLAQGVAPDLVQRAAQYLWEPGISVVREALAAREAATVHAMHDPTEGGLCTGLWELAQASQVGLRVEEASINVFPETAALCQKMGIDPLGLLASGALIIAAPPSSRARLLSALAKVGVPAQVIGKVTGPWEGLRLVGPQGERELPLFARDELARFLAERDSDLH